MSLDPKSTSKTLIDKVGTGGHLTADVEGLAIYHTQDGNGYLIASSQGNDAYNVYNQLGDNAFRGSFTIGSGNGIDSVQETDGLDVISSGLGPKYPDGLFVVHDHDNAGASNYKFVDWADVAKLGNLTVDPGFAAWDIL
jgi:3-phytase